MSGWSIINAGEAAPEPTPVSVARASLLGLAPAPLGRRVLASIIDAIPLALFATPLPIVAAPALAGEHVLSDRLWAILVGVICLALLLVFGLIQLISHGLRGQTLGKQMMRLRTIRPDILKPIGFGRALGRVLLLVASLIVPLVGTIVLLASPLWDAEQRRRGWHDHATRAWLIDLRAVDPMDPVAFEAARGRARVRSVGLVQGPPAGAVAPVAAPSAPAPPGAVPAAMAPAPAPAPASSATASPAVLAALARIRFDTGEVVAIHGPGLVGRAPVAAPDELVMHLLPIADDTRSISKTHFALSPDIHGLAVIDRGSTNGTSVQRGADVLPATPGVPIRVVAGDRILFGDRIADVID